MDFNLKSIPRRHRIYATTYRSQVISVEVVLTEAQQDIGLTNPRIANNEQLYQPVIVVVLLSCHD
jgi:hypothetical protein